ncbi:MAG: hypothetical protein J0L97_05510 [Alphaproteobacteria bacterium]|nr:hypothetical protein [Alphaproteobacteria bacterium]
MSYRENIEYLKEGITGLAKHVSVPYGTVGNDHNLATLAQACDQAGLTLENGFPLFHHLKEVISAALNPQTQIRDHIYWLSEDRLAALGALASLREIVTVDENLLTALRAPFQGNPPRFLQDTATLQDMIDAVSRDSQRVSELAATLLRDRGTADALQQNADSLLPLGHEKIRTANGSEPRLGDLIAYAATILNELETPPRAWQGSDAVAASHACAGLRALTNGRVLDLDNESVNAIRNAGGRGLESIFHTLKIAINAAFPVIQDPQRGEISDYPQARDNAAAILQRNGQGGLANQFPTLDDLKNGLEAAYRRCAQQDIKAMQNVLPDLRDRAH